MDAKEQQMRASINAKLIETGERERLKELLQQKLIECGWRDQVKSYCKDVVKQKGLDNITVEDLVMEMIEKNIFRPLPVLKKTAPPSENGAIDE